MKNIAKIISMLMVFSILAFILSACQQDSIEIPKGDNEAPKDNSEVPKEDNKAPDKNGENTQEASKGKDEKLDINPQVSIKEGRDYIKLDKPSIDFELKDLNSEAVKLSDYEGQIVFLNFWATWCPPCREEMPDMESIHQQYGDKGVAILAVSSTELELRGGKDSEKAEKQVRKFIEKEGYTFTIPLDPDSEVLMEYNNIYPVSGIPITFMIDREGNIRYARPGAFQGEEQLKAFIALLDE